MGKMTRIADGKWTEGKAQKHKYAMFENLSSRWENISSNRK